MNNIDFAIAFSYGSRSIQYCVGTSTYSYVYVRYGLVTAGLTLDSCIETKRNKSEKVGRYQDQCIIYCILNERFY